MAKGVAKKNEVCAMAQRTNLQLIAARGSQWSGQRIGGGTSRWRSSHKNRRQIVARGTRNRGQKNRQNVARANRICDILSRWHSKKSSATNSREGHVRNRGQHNQHNVARAKIIYDINYCKRRAQWRPKESAINRARGRARRRPNHSTNGVVGGANELTNCCKGGGRAQWADG